MLRCFSTDLSNLPPPTHAALSPAVFTLSLSFTSDLRVISSAIWSIASQIKNALSMTNLITSSQNYEVVKIWGQRELMSNVAQCLRAPVSVWFSCSRLPPSLLVLPVEASVYFGKAESIQGRLSFTLHRVHLACCLLYCKPLQCSSDVGKILEIHCYQNITGRKSATFYLSYFPLWSANEAKGKCRALHKKWI